MQPLIFRSSFFGLRAGMRRRRVRHTPYRALCCCRNRMCFRRQPGCDRRLTRIEISANFYMKSFALEFEIGERVVGNKPNQFPQLVHVNRSLEVLGQWAVPAATAISITMTTLGARLIRLFASRLLRFLIAHRSFDSGRHRNLRGMLVSATLPAGCQCANKS